MRLLTPLAVFVVAILVTESRTWAQEADEFLTEASPLSCLPDVAECEVNGYDEHRQIADDGAPGSPGFGFKHFLLPMHFYTKWYRPRAATLTKDVRCDDDAFRPRGFGHLFNRPCDPFRMEYRPYALGPGCSQYGPAYINSQGDQRCENCDECDHR